MKKILIYITFFSIGIITSCSYLNPFSCKLSINKNRIKSTCDLGNGVWFEKLTILSMDSTGLPNEFKVSQRFECFNGGLGADDYWPSKINFNKVNGHYLWHIDTVDLQYKMDGRHRKLIVKDSLAKNNWSNFIKGKNYSKTCPAKFEPSSWYYINFFDQRYASIFLYINDKRNFKLYVIASGVSPI